MEEQLGFEPRPQGFAILYISRFAIAPKEVDGIAGFEPANTGTKNQCLTAWRYPIFDTVVEL